MLIKCSAQKHRNTVEHQGTPLNTKEHQNTYVTRIHSPVPSLEHVHAKKYSVESALCLMNRRKITVLHAKCWMTTYTFNIPYSVKLGQQVKAEG